MVEKSRPGEVRDAVRRCLDSAGQALSLTEIQSGVSKILGKEAPGSSVRSILNHETGVLFVRTARGHYAAKHSYDPVFTYRSAKLYQADCFSWLRSRDPETIHAVVTDPPYGLVEYDPEHLEKLRAGRGGVWRIPPSFDGHTRSPLPRFTTLSEKDRERLDRFFFEWAEALVPVLVPGAHVLVASNPLLSYRIAAAIAAAGLERRGEVVRLVQTMRGGDRPKGAHTEFADVTVMPRSQWEPWLLFRKPFSGTVQENLRLYGTGGLRRVSTERPFGDVIASAPTRTSEKRLAPHPSLKPQAFLRQVVRAVLPLGDGIVLDPFCGSGSTLAAAVAVGYEAMGVERDPEYVTLAGEAIPLLAQYEPPVRRISAA